MYGNVSGLVHQSIGSAMKYVDLNRGFRDLTQSEVEDPELLLALADSHLFKQASWKDILLHPRVLILAEAGSGKTAEMREKVRQLRARGEAAFFIPIETLDRENVTEVLDSDDVRAFEVWKAKDEAVAWFFLDAVDELKLMRGKLERALRRVASAVDGLAHRLRIVISCRPTDWRASVDLATLRDVLPAVRPTPRPSPPAEEVFLAALQDEQKDGDANESPEPADVRAVVLLPMNQAQIETFASALGVDDAPAFIAEIKRQNAWSFARRPLDLSELITTWKERGRLGTLEEQHEANVTSRLKDDPDRPDKGVLSDARLQLGAERIALALTLTRMRTIRAPELSPDVDDAAGVFDSSLILADWSQEERQTLLRRGLFDPATYGRVRFHHRSVQEYLAACRLRALRDAGMSTKALFRLLFADQYGIQVVIPSMRPVAAWLALWDERVRHELVSREPETLLSMGDPEALPIPARAQLLRAFAQAYGQGGWRGLRIPLDEVRRLAHPELASVIRELWGAAASNEDVRELLLDLIAQGAIDACVDLAEQAALDGSLPDHHRLIAVQAVLECGRSQTARKIADSILSESWRWPDTLTAHLVSILFPSTLAPAELVALVERLPETATHAGFPTALQDIASTIDPLSAPAIDLRDRLATLVWEGRDRDADWYQPKGRFNYVAPALALLCSRQLPLGGAPDAEIVAASVIATMCGEDETGARDPLAELRRHFIENVSLRQAAFWEQLARLDMQNPPDDPWQRLRRSQHHALVSHLETKKDGAWLQTVVADIDADIRRRQVALLALLAMWAQRGRLKAELATLEDAVKDDTSLLELLAAWAAPPPPEDPRLQEMEQEHQRHVALAKESEQERLTNWQRWRAELTAQPDEAFGPTKLHATIANLYTWLNSRDKKSSRFNAWDREALAHAFGDDVANRAASAFREYWRTQTPALWSTRPETERNSTPSGWVWGLSGLAAEAAEPDWASRLTSAEAKIAAAYAPVELNGFPRWLNDLVVAHPASVDAVIGEELTREFGVAADHGHLPVVQNVAHGDAELKRLLMPRVLTALAALPSTFASKEAGERVAHHLDAALRILDEAATGVERSTVAARCEGGFNSDPRGALARKWLRGLFRFDPRRGVRGLEQALADAQDHSRKGVAIDTLAALFGHIDGIVIGDIDAPDRADVIAALVRLSYTFVRPEEDQHHEGVYSANLRDEAQRARGFLLSALVETQGPEAQRALLALADDPLLTTVPDRIRQLARERAARDAEAPAIDAAAVRALEQRYEVPPSNRDGLFDVMLDRLDDFAHDIAHHDFTNRRTLRAITEEAEMQRTLALRFEGTARGAYLVTRESEVADRKEPDIRLATVRGDQKASVEVKIADRWSIRELETALRNQLVGQYLRHENGRAGCLVLTYHGKSYWEHPQTGSQLNFTEVINHLAEQARAIEREREHQVRVAVYGLDLTDPPLAPAR